MKINLNKIKKNVKRVGRGPASNKGKTSGRGMNGQRSRTGSSTKFLSGGQTKLYIRLPKISGFKSPRRKDRSRVTISFDFILKNFAKTTPITTDEIAKLLHDNKIKKVKVIAGKDKIEKRKFDKNITLSKSIKNICDNS